jgi:branched-chain amino acid transport system substrate-binding protein
MADPRQAVSIANRFASGGIKLVVGHINSGTTLPASDVYAENGMLFITPSASNPKITERGLWNAFRTCARDDQQGVIAGQHLAKRFAGKRVAIVHDKSPYGQGIADETRKAMRQGGLTEVLYEGVNTGEKDFSALVSKLKGATVDVVYWGGLFTEGGLILRQMRDQNLTATMMVADGTVSPEFAAIAGPAVEGTIATFASDPRKKADAQEVMSDISARKLNPEAYTLYTYASFEVLKQAAEAARSLEPKRIAEVLHSGMTFKTVIGELAFDKRGDIVNPGYVLYVWKKGPDGKYVHVEQGS